MISIFRHLKAWGISAYVGGWTRSAVRYRARYVYWTGDRWFEGSKAAVSFASKEAASRYLEENRAMLEAALAAR